MKNSYCIFLFEQQNWLMIIILSLSRFFLNEADYECKNFYQESLKQKKFSPHFYKMHGDPGDHNRQFCVKLLAKTVLH